MKDIKKYLAEFIGTAVLVLFACGVAGQICDGSISGLIGTALAFGLVIVAMAYSIGNISGCHVNPAVSLAFWLKGELKLKDFITYAIAQCVGAFAGTVILALIFALGGVEDMTGAFGANGVAGVNGNHFAGLLVEIVLTFIFVTAILGVTSKKANHGSFGGLVIALTLVLVHILGIGLTGTSVNPARSLAPAVFAMFKGNFAPIAALWIFIVGPAIGAFLAAMLSHWFEKE